jgi:Tol biopolymer transport system component
MKKLCLLLVFAIPPLASGQQENPQGATGASFVVRKLAFEVRDGNFQPFRRDVFVADLHSKPKRLAEGSNPTWSPDGEKIVYCVREWRGLTQIQLANADGSGHIQLTKLEGGACPTDWSRDGQKIAGVTSGAKTPVIFVMGKNGDNITQVTTGYGARWSPDGKQLVFCREREGRGKSVSIWVANSDGTGATKVIEDDSPVLDAFCEVAWLPDGKSIVFASEREKKRKSALFRINLDGSSLETMAVDKTQALYFPVPSPDGTQVVADAIDSGETKIVLLDIASHHSRVLAHGIHPSVVWEKR